MNFERDIDFGRIDDLTIKEVKGCPTFSHFTDKQALEAVESLKILTKIAYDYYKKEDEKL